MNSLSSGGFSSRYMILLSGAIGVITALYLMRSRRKGKIYITKEKYIPAGQPTSHSNLTDPSVAHLKNDDLEDSSNNVGFGNDPHWMKKNRPDKKDLLHTGSKGGGKLVIVMVGLPGAGKTFIARKVSRFLRWVSYRTRVFSVAKYRLEKVGAKDSEFFNPRNEANVKKRNEVFLLALEDAMRYLRKDGEIAILDGSNSTEFRRKLICDRVAQEDDFGILWIEKILTPDEIVSTLATSLSTSPDFSSEDDFVKRVTHYQSAYETVKETEGSYIKLIGTTGENIHLHRITGFLRTKISSFVMNVHTSSRTIYLARAGESEHIARGMIGGDSGLTTAGVEFAKAFGNFLKYDDTGFSVTPSSGYVVWSSTMKSAVQTSRYLPTSSLVEWRALREIESGVCDGLTYDQIKVRYPKEFHARQQDKLTYRYPRGESYFDVITRLEPLIFEMERVTHPLIIVGHLAVLRCVYAYLLDLPVEEVPYQSINLNTLIRLDPQAYGCKEKRVKIIQRDHDEESEPADLEPETDPMARE